MSEHPGDNAINRFRAFWAGVLAFLSVGIVALIVIPGDRADVGMTPEARAAIDTRVNNLKEVRAAQAAALPAEKLAAAEAATLKALQQKKAVKSSVLVPGSATFMQQTQSSAAAPPAEPEAKPETPAKPEAAPAEPAQEMAPKPAAEPEKPTAPADPAAVEAAMALGKAQFMVCAACHGPDGKGLPLGPGLFMAPGYGESAIVKRDSAEEFALVVMKGIAKEDTKYVGVMAPLEAALDDKGLAGVLTYIRNTFGGHKDLVTPEQVAAWRAKYKDITAPVKRSELDNIVK